MMINVEELEELKDFLDDALAISQCAEDAAEEHIKRSLSIANGYLVTVQMALVHMIESTREEPA